MPRKLPEPTKRQIRMGRRAAKCMGADTPESRCDCMPCTAGITESVIAMLVREQAKRAAVDRLNDELVQTTGERCPGCGWRFFIPGTGCLQCDVNAVLEALRTPATDDEVEEVRAVFAEGPAFHCKVRPIEPAERREYPATIEGLPGVISLKERHARQLVAALNAIPHLLARLDAAEREVEGLLESRPATLDDAEIAELRRLFEVAGRPDIRFGVRVGKESYEANDLGTLRGLSKTLVCDVQEAELIAAVFQALPRLLARVEALQAEVSAVHAMSNHPGQTAVATVKGLLSESEDLWRAAEADAATARAALRIATQEANP